MAGLILPKGFKPAAKQGEFRQCQTPGCLRRAEYVPKLCVPAKGFPVEANKHLSVICGVPLCEEHLATLRPEQLLNRHVRPMIDNFAKGKVPPDYERSFILPVMIESNEYRLWARDKDKGRTK